MPLFLKYILFAVLSGVVLTFAYAPFFYLPLLFLALYSYIFCSLKHKYAWILGAIYGAVHIASSNYWAVFSSFAKSPEHLPLAPLATIVLATVHGAIPFGILSALLYYFRNRYWPYIFMAGMVLIQEYRTFAWIAFPWNFLPYSLSEHTTLLQAALPLGTYGLTFLITGIMSLIWYKRITALVVICSIWYGYGMWCLSNRTLEYHDLPLRLVQTNQPASNNFSEQAHIARLQTALAMSNDNLDKASLVIWPESGLGVTMRFSEVSFIEKLSQRLRHNSMMITGVNTANNGLFFNSLAFYDGENTFLYHKEKLVPFGEFIPLRQYLATLTSLVSAQDFSFGANNSNIIHSPKVPSFISLICYEIVFPNLVYNNNYQWLLNIVNDVWFEQSIGIYQHFAIAQFKARELGAPVVRVNNTGITAIIDQHGIVVASLMPFQADVLDSLLPKRQPEYKWLYVNQFFLWLSILIIGCCFFCKKTIKL